VIAVNSALRGLITALLTFIVYIVYTGSTRGYDIVTGIIVSIVAGALFANLVIQNPLKVLSFKRWLYLLTYAILYFLYYETKAHLDVIKRILHPKVPVNPAIIEAPYSVESDYAITAVANSITNTPGTVVVDIDTSRKVFYIHWINAKTLDPAEAKKEIFESFEKFARKIFD